MNRFVSAILVSLCFATPVTAEDSNGDFAIRGAGRLTCAEVVDALKAKDQRRLSVFANWAEGYITAQNQLQPQTFDAVPWQTTELLLALAGQSCTQRGEQTLFMEIIGRLVAEMRPIRLPESSDIVTLQYEDSVQLHYSVVLDRVRARLIDLGYTFRYDSRSNAPAIEELTRYLIDYQNENGLPPSGKLDQHTLMNLFVRPHE